MRAGPFEQGVNVVPHNRAFSLLELLVVLGIVALVLAILVPSLSAARESAKTVQCISNLREIGSTSMMYMEDEGYPTQPWHLGLDFGGADIEKVSENVWGGFMVEAVHPVFGQKVDVRKIHTIDRPYNRYVAPGTCDGAITTYICPSDRFTLTPFPDDPCAVPVKSENIPAWAVNGNSYAINWNWLTSDPWGGKSGVYKDLDKISAAGREMLRLKVGGTASEFIMQMESPMNAMMQDARPADGSGGQSCQQQLGFGWHRRFSRYTMSFLDGHAEFRFIDTRFSRDVGYDTWPERFTAKGF